MVIVNTRGRNRTMHRVNILAFGDIMGKSDEVASLKKYINSQPAIVFTGDIPNPEVFKALRKDRVLNNDFQGKDIKRYLKEEVEPVEALVKAENEFRSVSNIFRDIHSINKDFCGVFGNADLKRHREKVKIEKNINLVHNRIMNIDSNLQIIGYSGRVLYLFEKDNDDENAFGEDQIYNDLERIFDGTTGKTILITHTPPYGILDKVDEEYIQYARGTYGERAKDGHIGSVGLKKIVDKYDPFLHIFGHVHEGKGVVKTADTVFINVGSLGESSEFVEIGIEGRNVSVTFKKT